MPECEIGEKIFYDGMGDEVIEAWTEAQSWYDSLKNNDPHLLELIEHLYAAHGRGNVSPDLGYMVKLHKAAEIKGEFSL